MEQLTNVLSVLKECIWRVILSVLRWFKCLTVWTMIPEPSLLFVRNVKWIISSLNPMFVLRDPINPKFPIAQSFLWWMKFVINVIKIILLLLILRSAFPHYWIVKDMPNQIQIPLLINVILVSMDIIMTSIKKIVNKDQLKNARLTIKMPTLVSLVKIDSTWQEDSVKITMIWSTVMCMKTFKEIHVKNAMTELFFSTEPILVFPLSQLNFVIFIPRLLSVRNALMDMKLPLIKNVLKFLKINFVFKNYQPTVLNVFPIIFLKKELVFYLYITWSEIVNLIIQME